MFHPEKIKEVDAVPLRQLAVLGDAVCSLIERERAIRNSHSAKQLHEQSKLRVNAHAQAEELDRLMPSLNEKELDIVRRALNLKAHNYRKSGQATSRKSTAYEALLGYLYLTNFVRLQELVIINSPQSQ